MLQVVEVENLRRSAVQCRQKAPCTCELVMHGGQLLKTDSIFFLCYIHHGVDSLHALSPPLTLSLRLHINGGLMETSRPISQRPAGYLNTCRRHHGQAMARTANAGDWFVVSGAEMR